LPTIKGPIHIKGGSSGLGEILAEKFRNKELGVRLPFKAEGWRSKRNADMAAGKPLRIRKPKRAKATRKAKASRRRKK